MKTIAILSMLHEGDVLNSATRRFRNDPVIQWTLRRLHQTKNLANVVIAAWDDQVEKLDALPEYVELHRCGIRVNIPQLQAITAAQKWAEGWRGGLLATCAFDRGYVGEIVKTIAEKHEADSVVLIDPASGLVDPEIIDQLIKSATSGARDYYFTQSPPGLGGMLMKREMIDRLVNARSHPGRVVHYLPDAPVLDPVTSDACVPLPMEVSRSTGRFLMDSTRQIQRISQFTEPLNGTLISTHATGIAQRMKSHVPIDTLPRELVIELTTKRNSSPIYNPIAHHVIQRDEMSIATLEKIMSQIGGQDDLRITLAGVGDPLLHHDLEGALKILSKASALSLETDLIGINSQTIDLILQSNIDVISIHMPAITAGTYQRIMGVDKLQEVLENIKYLMLTRQKLGLSTPIVVPTFVKTRYNLDEMEQWYDTWLNAVQSAVIAGPTSFAGQIPDCSAADMSPTNRIACRRINSRLVVLSDGKFVACEQDFSGKSSLGRVEAVSLHEVWTKQMSPLRDAQRSGVSLPVICQGCKDWYRP